MQILSLTTRLVRNMPDAGGAAGTGGVIPDGSNSGQPITPSTSAPAAGEQTVLDTFAFDPFAEPPPAQTPTPSSADGQSPGSATPPTGQQPATQPPSVPGVTGDQLAAAVSAMTQAVEAVGATATAPKPDAPRPDVEFQPYGFQIPPQLLQGMASEDIGIRGQATAALVNGVAGAVHTSVVQHMRRELGPVLNHMISTAIENYRQSQETQMDFYGTYPEFNKPELKAIVHQIGIQVAREMNARGWNPQLRDAIAARMRQLLGSVAPQQPPVQTPAPPATGFTGIRPPQAPPGRSQEDQIADLLF